MYEKIAAVTLRKTMKIGCYLVAVWMVFISMGCRSSAGDQSLSTVPDDVKEHHFKTYFLKQKAWTLGDYFNIVDHQGNPRFVVHGPLFPVVDRLKFYDMNGEELALIKQRLLSLKNQYRIFRNQKLLASISKRVTLFKKKFIIDVPGPDDFKVVGNFTKHRYTFFRGGKPVAFITKKWFSLGDSYRIQIDPDEDDLLVLITAVVIDMACHDDDYPHNQIFMAITPG